MQTFTLKEAAALIANKYGWHEGAQKTLLQQLLDAENDGTLIVRHPHTDLPYRPKQPREFYETVGVSDLNRYFEAAGVPWRLDNLDAGELRTGGGGMLDVVKVFVSYSHQDNEYLAGDSLLGFLKGLEKDGISFWTDREIRPGEPWDQVIKDKLQGADIALVLVSQGFLDSDYCQNVEIKGFLSRKTHLFPVILSPCEWRRHAWLADRQFLPGGDRTVEEDYQDSGKRKRLFLEIRKFLRERAEAIRATRPVSPEPEPSPPGPLSRGAAAYSGRAKLAFCERLGADWKKLADRLDIPRADQDRFERDDEGRGIWAWLQNREALAGLAPALCEIERGDLVDVLDADARPAV